MPRTVVIIQARMGSTRLPGKVLRPIGGRPMIAHVVERARAADVGPVVVATSTLSADDLIADWTDSLGVTLFRGSEEDVLDRYYRACAENRGDAIVRITSDCPLMDPAVIRSCVSAFQNGGADYLSNTLPPRTFPRGLDVEVFSAAALKEAWEHDHDPARREHVTPFLYRYPDRFRLARFAADVDASSHRWTVDTPEDLAFVRAVHREYPGHDWLSALSVIEAHPGLTTLNRHVQQKEV